jgi:hypothetical protein
MEQVRSEEHMASLLLLLLLLLLLWLSACVSNKLRRSMGPSKAQCLKQGADEEWCDASCTSHVTRHTSHVTREMSHVKRHLPSVP